MNNRLAVFDFDDTLYHGQSLNDFLEFVYKNERNFLRKFVYKLSKQIVRYSNYSSQTNKSILFLSLKGIPSEELTKIAEMFYHEIIARKLDKSLISKLNGHQAEGDTVVLVSGGLELYLQYFARANSIDYLIATKIKFINNKFTKIDRECLGLEKLNRISETIKLELYNVRDSFVYSDHVSDAPILDFFGNPFFVVRRKNDIKEINKTIKAEWTIFYGE